MIRIYLCCLLFSVLTLGYVFGQDGKQDSVKLRKVPYGPVVKFEPSALVHHYSKALVGIEYFISRDISLQHQFGPILTIENYELFEEDDYDGYYGGAIENDIRFYYYNNSFELAELEKRGIYRTIKSAYIAMEFNYYYTNIDSYIAAGIDCNTNGECLYYQKFDTNIGRNWGGIGIKGGMQFVFRNNLTIDFNGGIGMRRLWLKNDYTLPEGATIDYHGIYFGAEEYTPYLSLSFLVGYCLK